MSTQAKTISYLLLKKNINFHFRGHMDITKIENIEKLFDTMDINLKDALVSYNNDYDPRVGIVNACTAMNKIIDRDDF